MKAQAKSLAKVVLERAGMKDQAFDLWTARTAKGRRGLKDDRLLAYFMATTLRVDSNCVDVGANRGRILADITRLAPNGRHIAVEPVPHLAAKLTNDFPTVAIHGIAVSNERGETTFNVANAPELSGLQQRDWVGAEYEQLTLEVKRLDDVVPEGHRVDFVKIDVEGGQVRVLQGATRVLRESSPALWIEHGARSAGVYGTSTRDLWDVLSTAGYRIWTVDGDGPLSWDALSATDGGSLWTFFAHR
jgi:FkbM family methyltransferase